MSKKLSKEELVELVNKICNPMLSDEEVSEYRSFRRQCSSSCP